MARIVRELACADAHWLQHLDDEQGNRNQNEKKNRKVGRGAQEDQIRRFYLFEEQSVGLPLVYLVKDIKGGGFEPALRAVDNWLKSRGFKLEILRHDAAKLENSRANQAHFAELGILGRPATVEEQRQNFVERRAQTVKKATASSLVAQNLLGLRFWSMAIKATVFTMQIVPNKKSGDEAPIWYFEHNRPNIGDTMKFPFGTPVIISRTGAKEWKFSTNNVYGITVGPDPSGNCATLCLIPGKGITPFSRKPSRTSLFSQNE